MNGDNFNNVRHEMSRYFRNKERKYLKDKINELQTISMNKNTKDLNGSITIFKNGNQP
jgi:hypothetical protein